VGGILEEIKAQLDRMEARLAKCAAPEAGELVDQRNSPLGRRRHCAAVRRLRAEGDQRVYVKGRLHMMTRDAVQEELARVSLPALPAANDLEADGAYARAMQKALAIEPRLTKGKHK
jgi:hypothetical protein